jgi:hypothetical protein
MKTGHQVQSAVDKATLDRALAAPREMFEV